MSLPFGSIENPFAKPVQRSKNTAELIGKILGPAQEMAFREALGSSATDETDLNITTDIEEEPGLTDRERLEITYNLTEQYEKETQTLRDRGLLEINKETGIEFIRGIDGFEYPLPSLETITTRLLEQKEKLDIKAEQGFTKLILVPFAVSLDRQIDGFRKLLLGHNKSQPNFKLREDQPIWNWGEYNGADVKGNLIYGVKKFSNDAKERQGLTKKQILDAQRNASDSLAGWRVELFQEDAIDRKIIRAGSNHNLGIRSIPRSGEGRTDGKTHPRQEIEAGRSSNDYLAEQLSDESGQTPEDWICAFIHHLQEVGRPLDDYENGEESMAFFIGAWFPFPGYVPYASWGPSDNRHQVFFFGHQPSHSESFFGSRAVVII